MAQFLNNLVTASIHGSVVILAVILLRLLLRKTPKKYICLLWLLTGIRLLMPIEIRSDLSLQPEFTLPGWNMPAILPWVWGIVAICFGIYSLVSYLKLKAENARLEDAESILAAKEKKFKQIARFNKTNHKKCPFGKY